MEVQFLPNEAMIRQLARFCRHEAVRPNCRLMIFIAKTSLMQVSDIAA